MLSGSVSQESSPHTLKHAACLPPRARMFHLACPFPAILSSNFPLLQSIQGTYYFVEPSRCTLGQILVVEVSCAPQPEPEGEDHAGGAVLKRK